MEPGNSHNSYQTHMLRSYINTPQNISINTVKQMLIQLHELHSTYCKPFNLAALKVGDFTCRFILAPFMLVNSNHTILRQHTMPIKVDLLLICVPFNFAVLFMSQNSLNKGHANVKGFTVS